jgi:hypothetical protein
MNANQYVIINDTDRPEPKMVCQFVQGVGYCYLDRNHRKSDFDGMGGADATSLREFGFVWTENSDGTVSFHLADHPPLPVSAKYRDGSQRRWQSSAKSFEFRKLTPSSVRKRASASRALVSNAPAAVMAAMDTETDPLPDAVAAAWSVELDPPVEIPADKLLRMVRRLLEFPYPQICRHSVACDLLSLLEEHGYPVTDGLAAAVVRADDGKALELLNV